MPARVKKFFCIFCSLFSFFGHTTTFTPKSGLIGSVKLCFDDHGSLVISRSVFSPTYTSLRSILRPRLLLQTPFSGSGMPNQVDDVLLHAMDGSELSRVRTEFNQLRILPIVSPHPVQPNTEFSGHCHFGNSFFPAHHRVQIPTSPVWVASCGCLCCFNQQEAQQCIALLADVSQPLPPGTGVLARNQPGAAADFLAARKPIWSPNDKNVS